MTIPVLFRHFQLESFGTTAQKSQSTLGKKAGYSAFLSAKKKKEKTNYVDISPYVTMTMLTEIIAILYTR